MNWYPLKFEPILKEVIWGGDRICQFKSLPDQRTGIGESWEISAIEGRVSVVSNGPLKGKTLNELISMDSEGLLGRKVCERFGKTFPLLIKFIDAREDLSVQVHPDDENAKRHHGAGAMGKTEMWYIIDSEPGSVLVSGFSKDLDKSEYQRRIADGSIEEVIHKVHPEKGDVFFISPGIVHAIGKGVMLAEIQQSSDYTYRIYDYNRLDANGRPRELHTELAADVLNFNRNSETRHEYQRSENDVVKLVSCPFFTTNLLELNCGGIRCENPSKDSFSIVVCTQGMARITWSEDSMLIGQGETVMIPAEMTSYTIESDKSASLLEVFI